MGLLLKINLILILVFVVTVGAMGYVSQDLMEKNARDQVLQNARLLAQTAAAVRNYTSTQIQPILHSRPWPNFQPQTVPAYSAQEIFKTLSKKYPDYVYKESALNPTNPNDLAADWEAHIVNRFRDNPGQTELIGERDTRRGRSLYLAEPIQIAAVSCLKCHSTPEKAPPAMINMYGPSHGFGWKQGEIIGARIVTVPMQVAKNQAQLAFRHLFGSFVGVFTLLLLVLNGLLQLVVIRPIRRLCKTADEVSLGNPNAAPFDTKSKDEIGLLAGSFQRMRISLEKSFKMLEDME